MTDQTITHTRSRTNVVVGGGGGAVGIVVVGWDYLP
jgi:hypothetical protein